MAHLERELEKVQEQQQKQGGGELAALRQDLKAIMEKQDAEKQAAFEKRLEMLEADKAGQKQPSAQAEFAAGKEEKLQQALAAQGLAAQLEVSEQERRWLDKEADKEQREAQQRLTDLEDKLLARRLTEREERSRWPGAPREEWGDEEKMVAQAEHRKKLFVELAAGNWMEDHQPSGEPSTSAAPPDGSAHGAGNTSFERGGGSAVPPAMQQALREITEMLAQAERLAGRPPDAMAPSDWQHAGERVQGQLQARLATLRRQEVETQGAPLSAALQDELHRLQKRVEAPRPPWNRHSPHAPGKLLRNPLTTARARGEQCARARPVYRSVAPGRG